jgi:predicted acylesterase/phospholipase RssA
MEISELEYIALEGGGGKGAVYKGAIVALEKLFDKAWREGELLKMEAGGLVQAPVSELPDPSNAPAISAGKKRRSAVSILDYYETKHSNLKIKGISGASAGAITAFPLALGLNSDDIDEVLKRFPFSKELLPNHKLNEGRYRMVGMGSKGEAKILIAEDYFRKLGESRLLHYEFTLTDKDVIGSNHLKSYVRSVIITTGFSIILTGLRENKALLAGFISAIAKFIDRFNYLKRWSQWLKSNIVQQLWSQVFGNTILTKIFTQLTPIHLNWVIQQILRLRLLNQIPWYSKNQLKLLDLLPVDNIVSALGNAVWDRGIYAGFEVRELFFKILLKAISRDTHFKRGLLKRSSLLESLNLSREELDNLSISFDANYNVKATDPVSRVTVKKLAALPEKLTFREFYHITGVNLIFCVTNSTTNQPLYFSHYFTPDFPVLEAVGSSMNFPIAFKPTYNEANVLLFEETPDNKEPVNGRTFLNPNAFVKFEAHEPDKRFYKESFSMRDYNKRLAVVLRYVKETSKLAMSVNGNLSFRSFLPYLRKIIENRDFHTFDVKDHVHNKYETYSSDYMKFLCYFYYNSAFKGLLIDGGVTNNLPLSIFTLNPSDSKDPQNLDIKRKVLGLKLDNSFPDVIKNETFDLLEKDKDGKALETLSNWEDKTAHLTFASRIFRSRKIRQAFENNKGFTALKNEAWVKISKELVSEYKETKHGFTPWNRQLNAVAGLMTSLQFGLDQGQIENIDDNENIIPLYCFGVDTLDFDLTASGMKPLVEMAVEESEKTVMKYFNVTGKI